MTRQLDKKKKKFAFWKEADFRMQSSSWCVQIVVRNIEMLKWEFVNWPPQYTAGFSLHVDSLIGHYTVEFKTTHSFFHPKPCYGAPSVYKHCGTGEHAQKKKT